MSDRIREIVEREWHKSFGDTFTDEVERIARLCVESDRKDNGGTLATETQRLQALIESRIIDVVIDKRDVEEELARFRKDREALVRLRDVAQRVWDSVPATHNGPEVAIHALALNDLCAALAAVRPLVEESHE